MLQKRKRLFAFAAFLLTISLATLAAILVFWKNDQPVSNIIASDGSKTIKDVTGENSPLTETTCKDIFRVETWPESKQVQGELAVRPYQVGDFDFFRIGDDLPQATGYGWFDDGKRFWWAQKNGMIRTATFPELQPLRELSFQGFRIHQLPERPVMEKREPWRKTRRELADLDFRGATGIGDRLFAIFGSPGYSDTNLVEIRLPSLDVIGARRMPSFFYDILDLDDGKTIAVKGDSQIGFLDIQTPGNLQTYKLGAHRQVRKDAQGLAVSIRDQETFALNKSGPVISMSHRPDNATWHVKPGKDAPGWCSVEVDVNNRVITARDSERVIGQADGFSLLSPRFHPDGKLGLAGISGTGTRMPGFGILMLAKDSPLHALVGVCQPNVSTTESLPEIRPAFPQTIVPKEEVAEREFTITNLNVQSVVGHVATINDTVIFDDPFLYYDGSSGNQHLVTRLNTSDLSVDFVLEDATLGAVTDSYIIIETQSRFLVLEKDSLKVVRDLGFNAGAGFAAGHYRDLFIADRFDAFNSPAAIDAATGERLMYYPRYGGACSSEQQLIREDPRWFDGKNDVVQRRFAGLTVITASGQKPLELAPSGNWAYSRFGLLQLSWPLVQHSTFGDMPRIRNDPGVEFLTQHFSHDSRFAFFPDNREHAASQKYVGVVRPLADIEKPSIELTTDAAQIWMDQNPVTGHFWVRVKKIESDGHTTVMRMVEFDEAGQLLRTIQDFTNDAQERRFLASGKLVCWGEGKLQTVDIK